MAVARNFAFNLGGEHLVRNSVICVGLHKLRPLVGEVAVVNGEVVKGVLKGFKLSSNLGCFGPSLLKAVVGIPQLGAKLLTLVEHFLQRDVALGEVGAKISSMRRS
jgi:hypothetical protein